MCALLSCLRWGKETSLKINIAWQKLSKKNFLPWLLQRLTFQVPSSISSAKVFTYIVYIACIKCSGIIIIASQCEKILLNNFLFFTHLFSSLSFHSFDGSVRCALRRHKCIKSRKIIFLNGQMLSCRMFHIFLKMIIGVYVVFSRFRKDDPVK